MTFTIPRALRGLFERDRSLLGLLARCAYESLRRLVAARVGLEDAVPGVPSETACAPARMRSSELKSLTWNDVNLASGKLAIFRRKTGTPDWIDMHPMVVTELARLRTERPHAAPDEHVFLNRNGAPWQDFRASWRRALKNAKLFGRKGLSFHSLRHTAAVHFMTGGGSLVDLQAQLGHADVATTMIYAAM